MTIKELRVQRKLTQDALAEAVGCSRITIARLEAGRAPVSMKIVAGLSHVLDVPMNELFEMLQGMDQEEASHEAEDDH